MYEEQKIEFDWKGFLLKLALLIIVIIIIIKLLPIDNKNKTKELSAEFKTNIASLKEKGTGYFTDDKLPTEVGESVKVSLDDLVKVGIIKNLNDKSGKSCDNKNSYVKVIKNTNDYQLEVHLECGKEKDTSIKYLTNEDSNEKPSTTTTTTTKKVENTKQTTKSSNNNSNNTTKPVEYVTSKVTKTTKVATNISVIFNTNGGTAIDSQFIEIGSRATRPVNPTRTGYVFLGWFYNNKEYNFNSTISSNIILIAKWLPANNTTQTSPIKYTITFNSNGGNQISSQSILSGGYVVRPTNPYKYNATFVGWYLNNQLFDFNTKIYGNVTLVAKYYITENYISDVYSIGWGAQTSTFNAYHTLAIPSYLKTSDIKNVRIKSVNFVRGLNNTYDYNSYQKSSFEYHSSNIENTPSYAGNFAYMNYAYVKKASESTYDRGITWTGYVNSQCYYTFNYANVYNACLYGILYQATWEYEIIR